VQPVHGPKKKALIMKRVINQPLKISERKSNVGKFLAETPEFFADCGQIKRGDFNSDQPPHFMTNESLQIQLLLQQRKVPDKMEPKTGDTYVAPLNCTFPFEGRSIFVVIYFFKKLEFIYDMGTQM
jgi:hypothetical protein